jgi:NAD(P)-dependent dehydrogenase (short-subunit alcohol dehydrogenase family)
MTRVAYVSGGGTGIGRATAAALAGDGWAVVVLGRRPDPLAGTVEAVRAQVPGAEVHPVAADLAKPEQVERAVAEAVAAAGPDADAIVNVAGGTSTLPAGTLAEVAAEWSDEWRLNVLTAVLLTTALLPRLRTPDARVITLSSIAALRGGGSYGAAKAALHPWTWDLAARLGSGGTANVVAPGYVEETEFFRDSMTPRRRETLIGQTTTGRPGRPADVAETIRWLLSPAAGHVSGQVVQVNGGALLGRG